MIDFVKSPTYQNWLLQNIPNNELHICSPFIKKSTIHKMLSDYKFDDKHEFLKVKIILRGNIHDFEQGSSDVDAVEYLLELTKKYPENIFVKFISNLHMKAYLIDKEKLLITSGNLTPRGLMNYGTTGNAEGGIACDDTDVIKQFIQYFNDLFEAGEPIDSFVGHANLKEIVNVNKEPKPKSKSGTKSVYTIPAPEANKFVEYADNNEENTTFSPFKIIINKTFFVETINIPQKATLINYEKALLFLCNKKNEHSTRDDLAVALGSKAKDKTLRARLVYGVIQNLELYGLVKSVSSNNLPILTEQGIKYAYADNKTREDILRDQSKDLIWVKEIGELAKENPSASIRNIVLEYLCSKPLCYTKLTAQRYVTGMVYIYNLHKK